MFDLTKIAAKAEESFSHEKVRSSPEPPWQSPGETNGDFRAALEFAEELTAVASPLLVLDHSLRVQVANASFLEHFRMDPESARNRLVFELGSGEWDIPALRNLLHDILRNGSAVKDFLLTHEFQSLGTRKILLTVRRLPNHNLIALGINDITDHLQALHACEASEVRYRCLFEKAQDGIFIVDPDTRKIIDANPYILQLLGYRREELLGKELWELGLMQDAETSQRSFEQLRASTYIRYDDLPLRNKDGRVCQVEFVSNLYRENGSEVVQCNIRDVSQQKGAEARTRETQQQLTLEALELQQNLTKMKARLDETRGDLHAFSYSIAHDMRAPLRAMQGYAECVLEQNNATLDEPGVHYLQQIMRAAVRLDGLIQDLVSYDKVAHSAVSLTRIDSDRLVRELILHHPARWAELDIVVEGKLPLVIGNEALMVQCFTQLLENAIKFVPPETKPSIRIRAENGGDPLVRLCCQDNGVGIAVEDQQRIFRLFERVHPDSTFDGTGIGLTIARKAAEQMGGTVGCQSALGRGSTFWMDLPKA